MLLYYCATDITLKFSHKYMALFRLISLSTYEFTSINELIDAAAIFIDKMPYLEPYDEIDTYGRYACNIMHILDLRYLYWKFYTN